MTKELEEQILKEFDEKFGYIEVGGGLGKENLTSSDIHNFLSSSLSRIEQETIKEIMEKIGGMIEYEDKREIWCPNQNLKLRDYWSHHDLSTYCENCGSKVEERIGKILKTEYEVFQALSDLRDYLSTKLKEK